MANLEGLGQTVVPNLGRSLQILLWCKKEALFVHVSPMPYIYMLYNVEHCISVKHKLCELKQLKHEE